MIKIKILKKMKIFKKINKKIGNTNSNDKNLKKII